MTLAILMFACRIRSLRELDRISDDAQFLDNWCAFSKDDTDTVICSRQMTNVLARTDWQELNALQVHAVRDLIRSKQLPHAYLLGHVMMVSDGTGIFSSSRFHCNQCLTQTHKDGSITYMHNLVELKLVDWNGWAFSVLSEFQLNPEDGQYEKQDCEQKAFKRLLLNFNKTLPRLPVVHLLDSLYCNGPCMRAITAARHKFICNFKPGAIPTLYEEACSLIDYTPNTTLTQTLKGPSNQTITRVYHWVNELEYEGLTLSFARCQETVADKTTTFAFLTTFQVNRDCVISICAGGRHRWTIENQGFNEQKNGYELEHFCDCNDLNTMLCLYVLLQFAHMIMQMLALSNLIEPKPVLRFLAARLLEDLRNTALPETLFAPNPPRTQIRYANPPP